MQDPFGNFQARITFPEKVKKLVIDVEVIAEMTTINPFDFFLEEYAERYPFTYQADLERQLEPYLVISEEGPLLTKLYEDCQGYSGQNSVDFLVSINQHINQLISYTIRMETGVQSCDETLTRRKGSCRDSAWLLVQLLRRFGLAARFVSGYLVQLLPDLQGENDAKRLSADFTDLHAWAEVFIPGAGWIGLDATSGLFAGEGHIPLAATPHYSDAAPLSGATEPAEVTFGYSNEVERILESPRVTKPYQPKALAAIHSLGDAVDQMLQSADVRLTMGGEPTFVSEEDMESEQWNTDADGDDKRILAYDLAIKLKEKFAPQGVIHCGQGKWYPGEAVPRWQYAMYWRKDGSPCWKNAARLANPMQQGNAAGDDARHFIEKLTQHLGLAEDCIIDAYEDAAYYAWEQSNLPPDHESIASEDLSIEHKTLLQLLERGIEQPVGQILPLRWKKDAWETCQWTLNRDRLFLIPGNSQMGYRLPLDRIAGKKEEEIEVPPSTVEKSQDLITYGTFAKANNDGLSDATFITALSVQLVEGRLHVFVPPFKEVNAFLDLVQHLESVCEMCDQAIVIEGYQPPFHQDVVKLAVTPDPGVVEVNVHPSDSWTEIRQVYDHLFTAAKASKLGTNKFMLDGRHTGTGGGNHITLGGKTPADSPLLRRPDLLRSMVTFWQNHPGLSYLFSSAFVGPTSQAPRFDEGRPDQIYELEIAFAELERHDNPPLWMVDRLFRNLLTDLTGNTHRAEFCIDKLYSPDSSTGRLGILELRGFDMPPHHDMCLVQLLLIRALVAAFWKEPYQMKLIHWGNMLHDRFMIHHWVKTDMLEVVNYLNTRGIAFDPQWLDVFLDFRFPELGRVTIAGTQIILRSAIEPWIVLGEEMTSAGSARYVDSSVERLEVMVENFEPERYYLLCNNTNIPLVKTDQQGTFVASIRYKAWAPPSALHPTIGVDTPLVFDLYDTWNQRSIGGCVYHVMHPGGRSFDTFPVNSLEAESRRATRFWDFNHSPKQVSLISNQIPNAPTTSFSTHSDVKEGIDIIQVPRSKDFPNTLDLRLV